MRRRKRQPEFSFEQFRVFAFGSDEELIAAFGSLANAEQAWQAARDGFLERWDLWGMPEAWWRFEPGVPDHIRSGPDAITTDADAKEWDRIEMERRRYLVTLGIDPAPERRYTAFGSD